MSIMDEWEEKKQYGLALFLKESGLSDKDDGSYAYLIAVNAFNKGFGHGWSAGYLSGSDSALANVRTALGIK